MVVVVITCIVVDMQFTILFLDEYKVLKYLEIEVDIIIFNVLLFNIFVEGCRYTSIIYFILTQFLDPIAVYNG